MACRALTAAAAASHEEVTEALLADARILAVPQGLLAAACAAAEKGHVSIIDLFLSHPYFDPAAEHSRLLRVAARFGQLAVVDRLLADGRVDPGASGSAPASEAAAHGKFEVLMRLLADRCVRPAANSNAAVRGAAFSGHTDCVTALLAHSSATAAASIDALGAAAEGGQLAVVELLLADENMQPSGYNQNALLQGAKKDHVSIVRRLLADSRVHLTQAARESILYAAISCGSVAVAALLLDGDPHIPLPPLELPKPHTRLAPGRFSTTGLLQLAVQSGRAEMVHSLLLHPRVDVNHDIVCQALLSAARAGHVAVVEVLLADPRADPAAFSNCIVWRAAESGHLAVVECLLADERVNPGACTTAALDTTAAKDLLNRRFDAVERLLADPRVDPRRGAAKGIFQLAAHHGHAGIIARLLADGRIDPASNQNMVLRCAAEDGQTDVVRLLLADPRVALSFTKKHDALCEAAEHGHVEVVKLLLADPHVDPAAFDNRAIQLAARYVRAAVVSVLLADPRVAAASTAVDRAYFDGVHRESAATMRLLGQLPRAAPPFGAADNRGPLALAHAFLSAAASGDLCTLEQLLAHDRVDPSVDDQAALRRAARNGHVLVVERLLADPRIDPSVGPSDLHWHDSAVGEAAQRGQLAVVRQLLADPRVDASAATGVNAAVSRAAWHGHGSVVLCLLEDPRVEQSLADLQLLFASIRNQFVHVADILLSTGTVQQAVVSLPAERLNDLLRRMVEGQYLLSAAQLAAFMRNPHTSGVAALLGETTFARLWELTDICILGGEAWRRRRAAVLGRVAAWDEQ